MSGIGMWKAGLALVVSMAVQLGAVAGDQIEDQKLVASDADGTVENGGRFGEGTSLTARWALIGALNDSEVADRSGAAYLFQRTGTGFVEHQKLTAPDGEVRDHFGYSVSVLLDTAVVASQDGSRAGSVYVYQWDGIEWVLQTKLVASDAQEGAFFGASLSLGSGNLIVGAPEHVNESGSHGKVYIFARQGSEWTERLQLEPPDLDANGFGISLSRNRGSLIVGAVSDFNGRAFVYELSATGWDLRTELDPGRELPGYALYGAEVAVYRGVAAVSAYRENDQGVVYVFERIGGVWSRTKRIEIPTNDGLDISEFGRSIALSSRMLIVGSTTGARGHLTETPAASVFARGESDWYRVGRLVASDGNPTIHFGESVSAVGDVALVGNATSVGSAYVYSVLDLPEPKKGDVSGDGATNAVDIQYVINAVLRVGDLSEESDVTGDGISDASDIQTVINAVLSQ